MIKKILFFLPLMMGMSILFILWRGLHLEPSAIPSPLINKPAPAFTLPTLSGEGMSTTQDLIGHVTLLHVWATWCRVCLQEHDMLLQIGRTASVYLYGLNYKDNPDDAKKWLIQYHNPYHKIAMDLDGKTAIDWGVYGTPETYILDKKARIRLKYIGPITPQSWEMQLQPLIQRLQNES